MTRFLFCIVTKDRASSFAQVAAVCGVGTEFLAQDRISLLTAHLGGDELAIASVFRAGRSGHLGGCVQGRRIWESEFCRFLSTNLECGGTVGLTTEVVSGRLHSHALVPRAVVAVSWTEFLARGPQEVQDRTCYLLCP